MLRFRAITAAFLAIIAGLVIYGQLSAISIWYYGGAVFIYLGIVAYGCLVLSMGVFVAAKCKGDASSGAIAITFDDGPVPETTEKVLTILNLREVKAAFFCIGNRVKTHPALVKQMHAEGHLIGNHSYWHRNTFDLQSAGKIENELTLTNTQIYKTLGVKPALFRPPYGVTNPMVAKAIRKCNFTTVGWSVRSFDTITADSRILLKRVTRSLKAGDIVLFHDYCAVTIGILPAFLDYVARSGLKIVRVDELLNIEGYAS